MNTFVETRNRHGRLCSTNCAKGSLKSNGICYHLIDGQDVGFIKMSSK